MTKSGRVRASVSMPPDLKAEIAEAAEAANASFSWMVCELCRRGMNVVRVPKAVGGLGDLIALAESEAEHDD